MALVSTGTIEFISKAMVNDKPHISVCVCTYKRLDYLKRLLRELDGQDTNDLFTYSLVVVDNDPLASAAAAAAERRARQVARRTAPDRASR